MPFQLDTGIYGIAPRSGNRQSGGLGTLSSLLDMQVRQEQLTGLKEEQKQRRLQMEKAQRELDKDAKLSALYRENPTPSLDQLIAAVGPETGTAMHVSNQAIKDNEFKRFGNLTERTAAMLGGLEAYPETSEHGGPTRASQWDTIVKQLESEGIVPAGTIGAYSKEKYNELRRRALTMAQQTQFDLQAQDNVTSALNAKTAASQETRLAQGADEAAAGREAAAQRQVFDAKIPLLQRARNTEDYAAIYNTIPPKMRTGVPTPWEYDQDKKGTLADLAHIGLSPAQREADEMRGLNYDRLVTNARNAELRGGGGGAPSAVEARQVRAAAAREQAELQQEVQKGNISGDQVTLGQLRIRQRLEQGLGQPPDPNLAEQIKFYSIREMEKGLAASIESGEPWSEAQLDAQRLAIHNDFLMGIGEEPVMTLPDDWKKRTTPRPEAPAVPPPPAGGGRGGGAGRGAEAPGGRGAGAGSVAPSPGGGRGFSALVNPAATPTVTPSAALPELARLKKEMIAKSIQVTRGGPVDRPRLQQEYRALRQRYLALGGQ